MKTRFPQRQKPDETAPFISPFLTLALRSRAQALADLRRARLRIVRRKKREQAASH